jgi:hypothetical protein
MPELENNRHEIFCLLCAGGMDETHAYAKVFDKDPRKPSTRGMASRLRSKAIVAARISELQKRVATKVVEEVTVTVSDVLKALLRISNFDVAELYEKDGKTPKNIHDIPKDVRLALAGIEVEETIVAGADGELPLTQRTKKFKVPDKNVAIQNLGRWLKMFTDRKEHDVGETLESILEGSWEKKK